ncbi:MAG: GAF domain-containing protein [Cyclobacteriaceae bacterium]
MSNEQVPDTVADLVEHYKKVIDVFNGVSSKINTQFDIESIYSTTFTLLDELFGFKHILILLLCKENPLMLQVKASHGYNNEGIGAAVPVGTGVIGVVAKNKKLLRMAGVKAKMLRSQNPVEKTGVPLPGIANSNSQLAVPLLIQNDLVGVMFVESENISLYEKKDESLLEMLSVQIAIAINTARQFETIEKTNNQLKDLNENLEVKVKERTAELAEKNTRLQITLDELTKTKISRKAITYTLFLGLVLFIFEEVLISPVIDTYFKASLFVSISSKGVIALLLRPIEQITEKYLLSAMLEKKMRAAAGAF